MKRETMLSEKHTVSTPRKSAAASITSLIRKRTRSPSDCNLCTIDSDTFQLTNNLSAPDLGGGDHNHNHKHHHKLPNRDRSDKMIVLPSPTQQVGVFGVDSSKRINVWNDAAAMVTGAVMSSKSCIHDFTEREGDEDPDNDHDNDHDNEENENDDDPDTSRRVFGMSFDDLFPSSLFEVSNTNTNANASITLVDVLDKVFQTGEPSMAVPVTSKAGRKRGRDEMTNWFSIDFFPQFKSCPMFVSSRNVSGVVLVCRTEPMTKYYTLLQQNPRDDSGSSSSLIDYAGSINILPGERDTNNNDKIRSLSAGSSGTCATEHETETETEIEIDNSFHTCNIDNSYRTNFTIDNSYRSCQIDQSTNSNSNSNTINTKGKNTRLEALEAFEASDSSDEEAENEIDGRHPQSFHEPASPLPARQKGIGSSCVADDDEDYRTLFRTVDSIIFGVDRTGTINEWNHKMEELTGISRDSALGTSFLEDTTLPFLPFPDVSSHKPPNSGSITFKSEAEPVLSKAYEGRSTSQFRLKLKSTKQQEKQQRNILRHLIASVSPRFNKQQEVVGALFLANDLTDGFMMYHSIKTDANELRKLIDTANAPIFGIDAHGYVNEWNDKTAEITGFSKDEAFGCLMVDTFIFRGIQDSVRAILRNALQHGKGTSNYELEFKTKCNEIRHLLVNITPQHDMNNIVVGVVLIAQDVTEAVERDRAVASMALELRQLIDTANAPIFGIDVHGKVNEWNTRMSTITGFAKEEAIDIPLVENFIAPSMKERVGEILEAALNGNETSNYEVEVPSKSGEPIFLLVNATTRRDPDSNVVGVVGVAQDVTEDRKHSKALRELETVRASQEAKVETERNMTAYFAHELRNPLGAIDSALAAMPDKLPENAQSLVTGMQLCTKFMSSIMNNLLDVRKMEEGKIRLGAAPISIRQMLHNVHEMLSPSVKAGVEFRKLINVKGNDWVLGDSHRMEQVLTNVISNAIKYTVSGHIQISIEWENSNVKFICEDTGPGIPKSEQAKLFQRFVQRGGAPGTGLGLAIAKHIVDLTGGSIRFESNPPVTVGTTCMVLMALPPCKAPESTVPPKKTKFITEPLSVLIIDDIKMNRTMVKRRMLKGIAPNAKIKEAATGEEALLICGTDKFDVMIVDQFMEGAGGVMVGTDVVFAMRRMRIDSVVIGCSGNDIGGQFIDAGADMVWQKPMPTNDQIIRDLRSSLDKRGFVLSCT